MNGRPFSAVVDGDINGDEATSNDLAFVFDPNDPSTPSAIAASMRKVLANPENVARDHLRDNLGHIASRYGVFAPWTQRIDVRLAKTIRRFRGQAKRDRLDVLNLANLLNRNWGAEYQLPVGISNQNSVVQRIPLLNVVGFNQSTKQYAYRVNENFWCTAESGKSLSDPAWRHATGFNRATRVNWPAFLLLEQVRLGRGDSYLR